jgi:Lhr-like helicase
VIDISSERRSPSLGIRTLTKPELQEIDGRLDRVWQSKPFQSLLGSRKDSRKEMHGRLTDFLLDRLADRPNGYRALIFVPGRAEAENLAQRLRNRLMEQAKTTTWSPSGHDEIYQRLNAIADVVDDQRSAEIVRRCSVRNSHSSRGHRSQD